MGQPGRRAGGEIAVLSTLPTKLQRFLDTLELFADRAERIQFLIDVADRFREVPETIASRPFPRAHEVAHCESGAYVWVERENGGLRPYFAVDNPQGISARAMAVILEEALTGASLEEVLAVPQDLPYQIFGRELSMGKSMGLTGLVAMVQAQARRAASD